VDADIATAANVTQSPVTSLAISPLPERWFPEIRCYLTGEDDLAEITLRVITEGTGPYWSLKMNHRTPLNPADADFLPVLGKQLCAVLAALRPCAGQPVTPSEEHHP
jgi:hypothetical protein